MLVRRRNTNTHTDDTGGFFGPTPCGLLRRPGCAQRLLAGLDRGADWLRFLDQHNGMIPSGSP